MIHYIFECKICGYTIHRDVEPMVGYYEPNIGTQRQQEEHQFFAHCNMAARSTPINGYTDRIGQWETTEMVVLR